MTKEFKYIAVRKRLVKELLQQLHPGDFLPPLPELCNLFNASTITVNRVLKELAAEGVIERIKHRGTRIAVTSPQVISVTPRQQLRILATHPRRWQIIQAIEKKLVDFCRTHNNLELHCEYTARHEQIERIMERDYDLVFADSGQVKLMLHSKKLRSYLRPLKDLPGLHLDVADYVPAAIRHGSDKDNVLYGMPLTVGPDLQLINRNGELSEKFLNLSSFYDMFFRQMLKLQQNREPILTLPLDYRYLEAVFRSYDADLFTDDMSAVNLESPAVKDVLKMLESYLHRQQLGLLVANQHYLLDKVEDNVLKYTPIPLQFASMINLKPGCGCQNFYVKNLPQARKSTAWLFWEGVLVGHNCDCSLAADVLNYLQSAAVQSMLPGCTALPARLDMQKLALTAYEPEFPGLTQAYTTGLQIACNQHAVPYDVLQDLNIYLCSVICGADPTCRGCKETARRINAMLKASPFLKN